MLENYKFQNPAIDMSQFLHFIITFSFHVFRQILILYSRCRSNSWTDLYHFVCPSFRKMSKYWISKIPRLPTIVFPKMVPCFPCFFLKYFGDKYGVDRSRISEHFRSSRNHIKSIAIGPESSISHFGIIKSSMKSTINT